MSLKDKKCDCCGRDLPDMSPDVAAKQMAAAIARGDQVQNPDMIATVCDHCWKQAIRRGWKPGSNNLN